MLGAFLALYPHARIKTLALVFFVHVPAWVYLGGWFLYQLLEAHSALVTPSADGSGVAFFAHIGGFVFGWLVARALLDAERIRPQPTRQRACRSRSEQAESVTHASSSPTSRRSTDAMKLPPVPLNLERAAAWTWRLLIGTAALALILALLWYLRVIVLPVAIALTIAPALSPVASWFRGRRHLERPAAALALLTGLALVIGLVAVATISVVEQFDELRSAVSRAVDDIAGQLEGEPLRLSASRTDELESSLGDAWREASGHAAAGVQTGAGIIGGVVLAVAMLYFVLRDGAALWTRILQRCSPEVRPAIDRAGRRAWDVLGGYVRGTATVATIDAVLIGIGLWSSTYPSRSRWPCSCSWARSSPTSARSSPASSRYSSASRTEAGSSRSRFSPSSSWCSSPRARFCSR